MIGRRERGSLRVARSLLGRLDLPANVSAIPYSRGAAERAIVTHQLFPRDESRGMTRQLMEQLATLRVLAAQLGEERACREWLTVDGRPAVSVDAGDLTVILLVRRHA